MHGEDERLEGHGIPFMGRRVHSQPHSQHVAAVRCGTNHTYRHGISRMDWHWSCRDRAVGNHILARACVPGADIFHNNFNSVYSGIENGVIGVTKVADYAPPKNKAKNVVRHLQKNTIVRISFPTIGALEKYVRPISKYV